jgi:hypothetical protein
MGKGSSLFLVLGIVIVALGAAGYYYFFLRDNTQSIPLVTQEGGEAVSIIPEDVAPAPGAELLVLLRNLDIISMDTSVLTNPAFHALNDRTIKLPPIPEQGKRNPFALFFDQSTASVGSIPGLSEPQYTLPPEILEPDEEPAEETQELETTPEGTASESIPLPEDGFGL